MRFGPYLKQLRLAAGLTQGQLAHSCRLTTANIYQLEKNKAESPTHRVCRLLARTMGVDGNELWKHVFAARLEKWLKREGFRTIPEGAASGLYDHLIVKQYMHKYQDVHPT
ncbi:MAG: helix-turn-helix domain-containing protein [Acidobacteriia bacterium]|nr:helix-turn-helix domain-containing protein [Terriglobia bacterium]